MFGLIQKDYLFYDVTHCVLNSVAVIIVSDSKSPFFTLFTRNV